jgi:hypothetical protein
MFDGIPFADLTAPSLLGITVILLLLGKIVPRATLVDKAKEAEKWRLAYEAEKERATTSDAQTAELLEVAKTTHSIIYAVFGAEERARRTGEAHVVSTKSPK